MSQSPSPFPADFEALEAAVRETPRGRWFLSEYLRRNQARETQRLLAAINKLENALLPTSGDLDSLHALLRDTTRSLSEIDPASAPLLPDALYQMASQAERTAKALETLDDEQPGLSALAAGQRLAARKLEILAATLRDLSCLGIEAGEEPVIETDNLTWFARDEDLFDSASADPETTAPRPRGRAEQDQEEPDREEPDRKEQDGEESGTAQDAPGEILPPATPRGTASRPAGEKSPAPAARDSQEEEGFMSIIIKPAPSSQEDDGRNDAAQEGRPRIIITRKTSSSELEIPFLDERKTPKDA